MFFDHRLTDDGIKDLIAETSVSVWKAVVLYFVVGLGLASLAVFILPNEHLQEIASIFLGLFMFFLLFKLVAAQVNKKYAIKEALGDEHLKASLSYGTYHKLKPSFFESKRRFIYYVKFRDENGKMHKCEIAESDDKQIFHTYKRGDPVIVLKYPRYKGKGYKYAAFDPKSFRNYSSLPFESWGEKDW